MNAPRSIGADVLHTRPVVERRTVADVAKTTDLEIDTLREIADARRGDPRGRCVEVVVEID